MFDTNIGSLFLAHQMRVFDILSWDRKSYLTHVILPRLSCKGCTLVVLELTHMVVMWCYWWRARKRIHYSCESRIEKSVLQDHRLSSLGKSHDARWSWGIIFFPFLTLMIDSYSMMLDERVHQYKTEETQKNLIVL